MKSGDTGAEKVLIWDLPSRVCHWGFAFSSSASLLMAFLWDPRSEVFLEHLLLGFAAAWFLAVRIVLGFCGCPFARWAAFFPTPRRTLRYCADVANWRTDQPGGLNPGTALFAAAIYLALVGLVVTGFDAEWAERWHGRLAWLVVGLIICHLLGLTLHALRHRAMTALAMVHGKGQGRADGVVAKENRAAGIALLVLGVLVTWMVFRCFDPATAVLKLPFVPAIDLPIIQKG